MSSGESSVNDLRYGVRSEIIPINVQRKYLSRWRESLYGGCAMLFVLRVRNLPSFSSKWVDIDGKSTTQTLDRQNLVVLLYRAPGKWQHLATNCSGCSFT